MSRRVVFDTNVVISALLFRGTSLSWLPQHWSDGCVPLVSDRTVAELFRVLGYKKFRLNEEQQFQLSTRFLTACIRLAETSPCPVQCRDPKDQPLLDLAFSGQADILVTGDSDLLVLNGQTTFPIGTPAAYKALVESHPHI